MSLKPKTRLKKKPINAIKALKKLSANVGKSGGVKVGFPKDSNAYPDGTSVIMVALVHEFGSPSQGIPERSYLRSTLVENKTKYKSFMKKLAKQVVSGKIDMKQALGLLGLKVEADIKDKITEISEPALTSREGNPLVLTGHLRRSVTHQVGE